MFVTLTLRKKKTLLWKMFSLNVFILKKITVGMK